jgi:hypothetical protein
MEADQLVRGAVFWECDSVGRTCKKRCTPFPPDFLGFMSSFVRKSQLKR